MPIAVFASDAPVSGAPPAVRRAPGNRAAGICLALLLVLAVVAPAAGRANGRVSGGPRLADPSGARTWAAVPVGRAHAPARDRALLADLPRGTRVGYHPATGRVRFLGGTRRVPLSRPAAVLDAGAVPSLAAAERAVLAFMRRHGPLFGVRDPGRELRPLRAGRSSPAAGRPTLPPALRFQQVRDGVPVLGGELIVALGPRGELLSVSGELLPAGERVTVRPAIDERSARLVAAAWLAREARAPLVAIHARGEGLVIHDGRLTGAPAPAPAAGPRLAWRFDVSTRGGRSGVLEHRLVLVDARGGQVLAAISRAPEGLFRRICDFRNRADADFRCTKPWARLEGEPRTGIADVDAAYRLMGVVDRFYRDRFGRDALDDAGAKMTAAVRYCLPGGCPMQTAFWEWGPQQATFGRGWTVDDIVAHELTHGVIDHEARLFYHYQSGALNESLADTFGELIDLTDGTGLDTAWSRWKIGEETPLGVLRDMRDPTRYGSPDRVRSPLWYTGIRDEGGVHTNSGVGNKAAFLVAAGGTFNGFTIAGLGSARTARVYYRAMTAHLTSASDYLDMADALPQACLDLAGTAGITLAHCKQVRDATRATEMHLLPTAGASRTAPLCGAGTYPDSAFFDDLEDPESGLWASRAVTGDRDPWFYPPNPNGDPDWDATWASSGELNFYGADRPRPTDAAMRLRSGVVVPEGGFLRFEHGFAFDAGPEGRYDGGVVELSLDGGTWADAGALFTHGGYTGRIATGTGNPLAGRRAFTAHSRGWGSSRLDVSAFAGQRLRVRFRIASDQTVGGYGWYIDDVRLYRCLPDDDDPSAAVTIASGAKQTSDPDVALTIEADDATTSVTRMRVSNSPELAGGLLSRSLEMPFAQSLDWRLTDAVFGGTPGTGQKSVYLQVRDHAGNWSAVVSDTIELTGP